MSETLPLLDLRPIVDDQVLQVEPVAERLPGGWLLRYGPANPQGARFEIEVREGAGGLTLRYRVFGFPGALDSFGVQFGRVPGLRGYLRQGYHSWDGSGFVTPDPAQPAPPGFAVMQLLPRTGTGGTVLGFDRHDRFQHTFTMNASGDEPRLTVLTLWDRKDHGALPACESETLLLLEHPEVEEGLREWARRVAAASPVPPRVPRPSITGWCSWYNLYAAITEENLLDHLRGVAETARREDLPLRVFQIDDGFTPEMGDWLDVKPQFPRGMGPLLDHIRAAGFTPGLWIAPFMVGNRSRLYREHPDWVIRDRVSGGPLVQERFYGEFRWHKRSEEYYILDTTHPGALAYLRRVFRTWRREWGCEYFKTDFMFHGAEHGPGRAVRHREGQTRIEVWRAVAEMIREEIGEALWVGCGAPLWASVGLVDAIRTGRDVGVEWHGKLNAGARLENLAVRNFAHQILWQADPDCVLLRDRFHHLSDEELTALALYAGMTGGVLMTSDDPSALSEERLGLWRLILSPTTEACRFSCLGRDIGDPVTVQVRGQVGNTVAVFFFNTGDAPVTRRYPLADLGLPPLYVRGWQDEESGQVVAHDLDVTLGAHQGALFFLSATPLEQIPSRLPGPG